MKTAISFFLLFLLIACSNNDDTDTLDTSDTDNTTNTEPDNTDNSNTNPCSDVTSTFDITLDPDGCEINIESALGVISLYQETIEGSTRKITVNSVASHLVGGFPNPGNPNTIAAVQKSLEMPAEPAIAENTTSSKGSAFGVMFSGVVLDPFTGEFFTRSNGTTNREWNITTLTNAANLGLDCNNAHVQPNGTYHYHGAPSAYIEMLVMESGEGEMIKLGYAADGFPIYYKYGYDDSGNVVEFQSGYRLKEGERPGDGSSAPDGCYDGLYFQDYEYVEGVSSLDACNGRTGRTPESDSEYYYVVTDNFPSSPLCFSGTPDSSFKAGGGTPPVGGRRTGFWHSH